MERRRDRALSGVEVVGEVESGLEVLRRARDGDLDVVMLDIAMPGPSGLLADDGRLGCCAGRERHQGGLDSAPRMG